MLGGAYLAFEATEKIMEKILHDHEHAAELLQADTPKELEDRQVAGAIRTDLILSAEIMAIALNELGDMHAPNCHKRSFDAGVVSLAQQAAEHAGAGA